MLVLLSSTSTSTQFLSFNNFTTVREIEEVNLFMAGREWIENIIFIL